VNIASVNLNLLLAFEALLEEQHVGRAATRIGLSQPAMSNALARLREVFGDPLFQRTSRGMKATARALELAGSVRNGLSQLRSAFEERPRFDPAASARSFRIAMTDYAELVLLGPLLRSVMRTSPSVQIVIRRVERIFVPPEAYLRPGTFDAAIGFFPEANALDPRTRSLDLFAEENVCIVRRGHPLIRKRFTLREFASAGHVGVFYGDDTVGLVDNILAGHGMRPAVAGHYATLSLRGFRSRGVRSDRSRSCGPGDALPKAARAGDSQGASPAANLPQASSLARTQFRGHGAAVAAIGDSAGRPRWPTERAWLNRYLGEGCRNSFLAHGSRGPEK
jgi:DNA-binding transcriptional LysR family regulator